MRYKAFMSYSHAADGKLAPAVESGLKRFAKPWYRLRAMQVFRDESSLSVNEALWPSIEQALGESEYFVLLASPEAARSPWVAREVQWWLTHHSTRNLLIVFTDGDLIWDEAMHDFDWSRTTAIPNFLGGHFKEEPLHVDLRWARTGNDISLRHSQFRGAVLKIAAKLHGKAPEDMDSEEVRQHRIMMRTVWAVVIIVLTLIGITGFEYLQVQQAQLDFYLAMAQPTRRDGQLGERVEGLAWVKKAAEIRPSADLRTTAIANMMLVDLMKSDKQWKRHPVRGAGGLVFDSNLERYAHTDDQGNILVRRVSDDQTLAVLTGLKKPPAWVFRFSRNGQFLAVKDEPPVTGEPGQLHLWDLRHGNGPSKVLGSVCNAAFDFSPDNQLLAFSCDGPIHLVNIASGQEIKLLAVPARDENAHSINSIAFHPDGRHVAISGQEKDRAVLILNLIDGHVVKILPHPAGVNGIAWSDDGKLLATACDDFRVYVWDADSLDKPPTVLQGHRSEVRLVTFNHGGNLLASSSWDQTVRLWDPVSGRQLVYSSGSSAAWPLQFSADGQQLAFRLGYSEVGFWQVAASQAYRTFTSREGSKGPFSADFSLDGRLLVSAHHDGLRLWDVSRSVELCHLNKGPDGNPLGYVRAVRFHPNGQDLISGGPRTDAAPETGTVDIWRIETNPDTANSECPEIRHLQSIELPPHTAPEWVSIADDGKTVAVADDHGQIVIFDPTYKRQKLLQVHPGTRFVTVSSDGRWIASSTWGGVKENVIEVFDLLTGEEPVFTLPKPSNVSVAFSPDSRWLVTGSGEEYSIWRMGSWEQPVRSLPRDHPISLAGPIAFTADSKVLAIASSEEKVTLLNAAKNWEEIASLVAPDQKLLGRLRFSHTGQLAAISENNVIQLWDLGLIREQLAKMGLDFETDARTFSDTKLASALSENSSR